VDILLATLLVGAIIWIFVMGAKYLYRKEFRSFSPGIVKQFKEIGLQVTSIEEPTREDWEKSPFKKPPSVKVSLVQVRILGMMIDTEENRHFVVMATNKSGKLKRYWVRTTVSFATKTAYDVETF